MTSGRTHGGDIVIQGYIHGRTYSLKDIYMKSTYRRSGHSHGGTYTRRTIHKIYTEEQTHERMYIRRDIYMKGGKHVIVRYK